jgi:hypothetical protein
MGFGVMGFGVRLADVHLQPEVEKLGIIHKKLGHHKTTHSAERIGHGVNLKTRSKARIAHGASSYAVLIRRTSKAYRELLRSKIAECGFHN